MITHLAHVNLTVPEGTLHLAEDFYANTLGLTPTPVPHLQRDRLRWFNIGNSGQQVHIAIGDNEQDHSRHPCFHIESGEALVTLKKLVYDHFLKGDASAPKSADKPGEIDLGDQSIEYPSRFFARDFAGNRLEFSL